MYRFRRLGRPLVAALLLTIVGLSAVLPGRADTAAVNTPLGREGYLLPPKEIADAVLATRQEIVTLTNLSPDGKKFLISKNDGMPSLQRMARPTVYLGEVGFDPVACRARDLWLRSAAGFEVFYPADKRSVAVQVPERARVGSPAWSPDGSKIAFYAYFDEVTHIYVADAETGYSRRLTDTPVLATMATAFQWSRDGNRILTVLLPDDGKRERPRASTVAPSPKVRVTRGGANPSRTFRYLLESPDDMKLLEYLATGQLALVSVHDGHVAKIGFPNLIRSVSAAPGEELFRVTLMKKPFSYYVPLARFGAQESIWNQEGKSLVTLNDRNLRETEPQTPARPQTPAGQRGQGRGRRGAGAGQTPAPTTPAPLPTDPQPNPDDPTQPPAERVDPDGKRDLTFRPDGVGLSYLQLEPAKAADDKTPRKDRVLQWLPPFGKDSVKVVYATPDRITSAQYSDDCQMLFLTQTVGGQRQISAVDLADPKTPAYVLFKAPAGGRGGAQPSGAPAANPTPPIGDGEDDEQQPVRGFGRGGAGFGGFAGPSLMTRTGRGGVPVVRRSSSGDVYLTGSDRPAGGGPTAGLGKVYIDKVAVKTGAKTRIFESKGDLVETVDAVDGDDVRLVYSTRQKKDVVPDAFVTDVQTKQATRLTSNVDPAPWFNQLQVQRFRVTRVDGIKFWVKVTTPPKAAGKLPALFWIYPREYTDQAAYDAASARTAAAGNRFNAPNPRSMALLTLAGYAVVEPDVPIMGPAGRMNDNYIPDLRNSLWAAIDELDKKGIIDRDRLAVGGHSYGAFSTANALAHTPFFKAGIAGDGNYNRTLTTMTFQTERRQIWDARETYLEMSPLLWANRVHGALLMYHGMDDANVGTNPINAEHMFMALDGLGKPAALYMYPYEGHGPLAKETTLDLWARWVAWLDLYVKNPQKKAG